MAETVQDVFNSLLRDWLEIVAEAEGWDGQQIDEACAAMRARFADAQIAETEQQKQCPYCHSPEVPIMGFRIKEGRAGTVYRPTVASFDGNGISMDKVKQLEPYGDFVKFHFCPMCGRRLEEKHET